MFSFENKRIIIYDGPLIYDREISLTVKRLDLTDPVTGGNKWFKLKYNLEQHNAGNYNAILTFGGAYSNHIAAVAGMGKQEGIKTIGIIRGERESQSNITLSRAQADGMKLVFVSREDYRKKEEHSFLKNLVPGYENCFIIPEGGSNNAGVKGCMEILDDNDALYSHVIVACGTGTTATGLILRLKNHQKLIGISVLRAGNTIENAILKHLIYYMPSNKIPQWHIENNFHFGGYGKSTPALNNFVEEFFKRTGIPIEPVYTGKMFFAIEQLINSGVIATGSKILAIHTGGLQYMNQN